ncbi:MAG: bifunctional hydroxymethylpyrimidine kinase/phosphomethylpyrimidine kinase [Firmicutes bacterium]|nr:bifunctional hydroxymethylpyrimidine kinase/phosphomethylpyrimidine kinase [Bacillota bacterium]
MHRQANGHVSRAVTIAGSDSGGGAGIQADLKTFCSFGVYGACCVTALTAQNTRGVQSIFSISPAFIQAQLDSLQTDIGADAIKTGMLGDAKVIQAVASALSLWRHRGPLVVDPVMVAKGGTPLLPESGIDALRTALIPLADVVTPNLPEAEALSGLAIRDIESAKEAALKLAQYGARAVIIKGGHGDFLSCKATCVPSESDGTESRHPSERLGTVSDLLLCDGIFTTLTTARVPGVRTHGTGCTFSAAITACLARGVALADAIATARRYVYTAIESAQDWDLGTGHGPIDHAAKTVITSGLQKGHAYVLRENEWSIQ